MSGQEQGPAAPVTLRQIGVSADGAPLYAYRDAAPVAQPAPTAVRPYGAYIGVGVLAVAGVTALAMVAAILAVALALSAVSLTVCTIVLRSMWQQYQQDRR